MIKVKRVRKQKRSLWVVKTGSNLVCTGGPLLIRAWMQQVAQLQRDYQIDIVWVTSGAIASAIDRVGSDTGSSFNPKRGMKRSATQLEEKQALSAIGQPIVMDLYNLALQAQGLMGAQILLSYDDLTDLERRANFQNTVKKLLDWGVTPVLNENDAVATQEIRFGDNDSLSAKVAHCIGADQLVILTDVEGLFDSDPSRKKNAQLIPHLPGIDENLLAKAKTWKSSNRGTGGIYSKLKAAHEATSHQIETWIANGNSSQVLLHLAKGQSIGTWISCANHLIQPKTRKRSRGKK